MAKLAIVAGATSQTVNIFIQDSSSTTGAGLTGLAFNTASLTAYYALPKAAAVSITLATLAAVTSAYSSGGFKEIDATNMPGWYRFDIPDAAIASGRFTSIHFKGATNMAPLPLEIELTGWNNQDSVHGGMSAIPNASPGAANGMFIAGTNAPVTITGSGDALTLSSSGGNGNGLNVSGNGSGDGVKSTGGATGNALELVGGGTSGDGLKVTTTSGHGMNIAATGTSKHGITATGGNAGTSDGIKGAAGTGGVDIRGNITGNITGNLSGSAGSVTGAVGSVTGAVGSVTGAVGSVTAGVSVANGGIASTSFAAAAIDAAAIATDAIGSAELAAGAVTKIAAGVAAIALTEPTAVTAASPTLQAGVAFLHTMTRNTIMQTATQQILKADDTTTTIASSTLSDDGTTFTKGEFA